MGANSIENEWPTVVIGSAGPAPSTLYTAIGDDRETKLPGLTNYREVCQVELSVNCHHGGRHIGFENRVNRDLRPILDFATNDQVSDVCC